MRNTITSFAICVLITSCGVQENSHRKENPTNSSVTISKDSVDSHRKENSTNSSVTISKDSVVASTTELPFIGIKHFETRHGVSGTGTPYRSVEIRKNGDVFFSFIQENQGDKELREDGSYSGTITEERYYAGKFKPIMKCFFKKWDNETMYFEITKDTIYQVDTNNKRLANEECCNTNNFDLKDKCPCESIYFESIN